MKLKHRFNIEGTHKETDLEELVREHAYDFTKEHLEFVKEYPGLVFEGSRLVKLPEGNTIGTPIIHNFFSVSDILYVLRDDAIMEAFEDLPKEQIGSYCILTFSHTETEIFVVGAEERNKNNIFVYSSITDEIVLVCNGIENFFNNYLYFG